MAISVPFGQMGVFRLKIKSEGKDKESEVNGHCIKDVDVVFKSSPLFKERLQNTGFEKEKMLKNVEEVDAEESQELSSESNNAVTELLNADQILEKELETV